MPPSCPDQMADAILTLIEQPALSAAMGRAAQARVAARYEQDDMIDAYARVYRETLGEAAPWPA